MALHARIPLGDGRWLDNSCKREQRTLSPRGEALVARIQTTRRELVRAQGFPARLHNGIPTDPSAFARRLHNEALRALRAHIRSLGGRVECFSGPIRECESAALGDVPARKSAHTREAKELRWMLISLEEQAAREAV